MRLLVTLLAMLFALAGCDRRPPRFPVPQPSKAAERVDVQIVAPLLPDRATHLARADEGTIWWVQETAGGADDVAFALGADGVPRATGLTAKSILAALSIRDAASGGHIQSLAAGADGRIWFYFAGGAGRRDVAAIGSFDPARGTVHIAADTDALRRATGMGASLVLARGSVVRSGGGADDLWAWVRHSDGSGLFRIDAKTGALTKPFDSPATDAGPIAMTRPGQRLGGSADGLLLLDVPGAELWRIDAAGRAASLHTLSGLPRALSAPAMDANGRAFIFAADAPLIPARSDEEALRPILSSRYPALLVLEDGVLRAIGQDAINAPPGVVAEEMRVQQLIADPSSDAVIGYDESSGALLRFRIVRAE